MKSVYYNSILIVFMLCIFTACEQTIQYPETMLRAERILDTHPDSALSTLISFKDSSLLMRKPVRMYYNLLLVKAKDKCYIAHTSDSLISEAVRYYEKSGTAWQRAQAYYYMGSVYRDIEDAARALEYFQKALDSLGDYSDHKFKGLIYSQIGTILMHQTLFDEALPAFHQAYYYDQLANDSLSLIFDYRDIGRYYNVKGEKDSSLFYFTAAWKIANKLCDKKRENIIATEWASIYLKNDEVEKARIIMRKVAIKEAPNNSAFIYDMWGDIFKRSNELDSSAYFYQKALLAGNVYIKCKASLELYKIADLKSSYNEAKQYMRQYVDLVDSVQKITQTESISKMHALYNRHKMETEKAELETENYNLRIYLLFGTIISLLTIVTYYQYSRKRRLLLELQKQKVENILEIQKQKSEKILEENRWHIAKLDNELQEFQQQNDKLQERIFKAEKGILENRNHAILAEREKQQALLEQLKQSEIYKILIGKIVSDKKASDIELCQLGATIDKIYENFTTRLQSLHPSIKQIDIYMCYLIKVNIPLSGICILLVRTSSGVSMARKRLSLKILGESASIDSFDELIRSL